MLCPRSLLALLAAGLTAAAPPLITTAPDFNPEPVFPVPTSTSLTFDCSYEYCDGQTSWCFYWGGITGYDVSLGPLPGEVRTSIGLCGSAVSSWTQAVPTE